MKNTKGKDENDTSATKTRRKSTRKSSVASEENLSIKISKVDDLKQRSDNLTFSVYDLCIININAENNFVQKI